MLKSNKIYVILLQKLIILLLEILDFINGFYLKKKILILIK